jgi:hypothetical protein
VSLHVVEFTLIRGFDSFCAHHLFNLVTDSVIRCGPFAADQEGHPNHLTLRFSHFIRDDITADVHGGADVSVSHQLLLNSNLSSCCIKPASIGVTQCVSAELADPGLGCCL